MAKFYFKIDTRRGEYMDTIFFPDDAPMSAEEIVTEIQRRVDNWLAMIEAPVEPEPEAPSEPEA
jgi:hypothetical protein